MDGPSLERLDFLHSVGGGGQEPWTGYFGRTLDMFTIMIGAWARP